MQLGTGTADAWMEAWEACTTSAESMYVWRLFRALIRICVPASARTRVLMHAGVSGRGAAAVLAAILFAALPMQGVGYSSGEVTWCNKSAARTQPIKLCTRLRRD